MRHSRPAAPARRHPSLRLIAVLATFVVSLAVPAVVSAQGPGMPGGSPPPPGGENVIPMTALEVTAVDKTARTVTGKEHCVPADRAGKSVTVSAAPAIDLAVFRVGSIVGVQIVASIIERVDGPPCNVPPPAPGGGKQPAGPGNPGGDDRPGGGQNGGQDKGGKDEKGEQGGEDDELDPRFLSRVWKFDGEVDGYKANKLSITVGKILNLPKKFRDQDDEVVDEDAIVLVSSAKIYDKDKKKTSKSALEDAENVRIQGKILPEDKWQEDEDGTPVTTIRAKKVYITG